MTAPRPSIAVLTRRSGEHCDGTGMSRSFRSRSGMIGSVAGCLAQMGLGVAAGEIGQRAFFNNSTSDFGLDGECRRHQ